MQLSADRVPLVLHDENLRRTHGLDVTVTRATLADLAGLGVLADGGRPPAVPRLAEFAAWLRRRPALHAFVELKSESLRAYGRRAVLAAVGAVLPPPGARITVISYDSRVLAMAKRRGYAVGYVLPGLQRRRRATAQRLAPGLLLAERHQLLCAGALWPGAWRWAAFEIADAAAAQPMLALGVHYLETMDPAGLLRTGIPGLR